MKLEFHHSVLTKEDDKLFQIHSTEDDGIGMMDDDFLKAEQSLEDMVNQCDIMISFLSYPVRNNLIFRSNESRFYL